MLPEILRQEWPRHVAYKERLVPGSSLEVELPPTRHEALALWRGTMELAATDPQRWRLAMRQYMACDWYFLALSLSCAQRWDAWHKRPEIDCDFQFAYSRCRQFFSNMVVDYSARAHWKSTWTTHVGILNAIVVDPDISILIASMDEGAADKHMDRNKMEMDGNKILKAVWPEVFWANEEERISRGKESDRPAWSKEKMTVKGRIINATSPTLSSCPILRLPTGGRFGVIVLDDVENDTTVLTEDGRTKLLKSVDNLFNASGRMAKVWVNGTMHHPAGLISQMRKGGAFMPRCVAIEDRAQPAPDIAALFDEVGGKDPAGEPLNPNLKKIRLDGAPVFLHPLEVAQSRLRSPLSFYMQNMGDPVGGVHAKLAATKVRRYAPPPREWAIGKNIYLLVDGARGDGPKANPSAIVVAATGADQSLSWLDGVRRVMQSDELNKECYRLYVEWMQLGREVIEIRVEIYGQATWDLNFATYFGERGLAPVIQRIGRPVRNRVREESSIQPFLEKGRWIWPQGGIWTEDEEGIPFDMCQKFIDVELDPWPMPEFDDVLACWAMAGEPPNPKTGLGPLVFPRPWEDDPEEGLQDPMANLHETSLWSSELM